MSVVRTAEELGVRRSTPIGYRVPRAVVTRTVSAGVVAGVVAGLTMAVVMAALSYAAAGKSPFMPFVAAGASVLATPTGASGDAFTAVVGFAFHMAVPSLAWGAVYGILHILTRPKYARTLLFMGLVIGSLAQVIDANILVPGLGAIHVIRDAWTPNVHPFLSWLFHLSYGVGLSIYPWKYDPVSGRFM
jgi:hypothetical protein